MLLAAQRRRFGYRRIHALTRREDLAVDCKRVQRIYCEERLQITRRKRRRVVAVERRTLEVPRAPSEVRSIDFVSDSLEHGRRLKCLTIVDDYTKGAIDILVDHGISGEYVTRGLDRVGQFRDECLNEHWFRSLAEARDIVGAWRADYNQRRPHAGQEAST